MVQYNPTVVYTTGTVCNGFQIYNITQAENYWQVKCQELATHKHIHQKVQAVRTKNDVHITNQCSSFSGNPFSSTSGELSTR